MSSPLPPEDTEPEDESPLERAYARSSRRAIILVILPIALVISIGLTIAACSTVRRAGISFKPAASVKGFPPQPPLPSRFAYNEIAWGYKDNKSPIVSLYVDEQDIFGDEKLSWRENFDRGYGLSPDFYFLAGDADRHPVPSRLECQLDRGRWHRCVSPEKIEIRRNGSHTFRVRATDPDGDTAVAVYSWVAQRPRNNKP